MCYVCACTYVRAFVCIPFESILYANVIDQQVDLFERLHVGTVSQRRIYEYNLIFAD